jgi:uncharacterized tellurite resistance protein B-like protein
MLERLRAFLDGAAVPAGFAHWGHDDVEVAAAALLVEAARVDGGIDAAERATIAALLSRRFGLAPDDAEALLATGAAENERSIQLQGFAQTINAQFTEAERIELVEMLWEVVYADGVQTEYEANLLRRIGGLLYVTDRDRGAARQRVLARLGRSDKGES